MKNKFSIQCAALVVMAAICGGTVQAAEKMQWWVLEQRFPNSVQHRSIDLITKDGQKHHGSGMALNNKGLKLFEAKAAVEYPRETVARIEIRQTGRFTNRIRENAVLGFYPAFMTAYLASASSIPDVLTPIAFAVTLPLGVPVWAYTAASAPVFLAADGISVLLPPAVYELVD